MLFKYNLYKIYLQSLDFSFFLFVGSLTCTIKHLEVTQ